MNCQDFRELSDSYLSDELLVETNHEVIHHLENCHACRQVLSFRRELRGKLRQTLKNSPEFQPNFAFETRLKANLKDETLREKSFVSRLFGLRHLATAMASLLVVFAIGFGIMFMNKRAESNNLAEIAWQHISKDAIGDHQHCAIEKLEEFKLEAKELTSEKVKFDEKYMKSLQANLSPNVEILASHDCKFNGRIFTHTVLKDGNHIVSVLSTESKSDSDTNINTKDSIASDKEQGFQIASFKNDKRAIFVISDLSETENMSVARTISNSI
jgi:hypothetical protein